MVAATMMRLMTFARKAVANSTSFRNKLTCFSLAFPLPFLRNVTTQSLFGPAETLAMNHFTARAMSNRCSEHNLGTKHQMPIPWYSGATGQFMRLDLSIVLIVSLLALTEEIAVPAQEPQKVHRIGWISFNGSGPPRDFMTGLRERGYIEGQSIIIDYRSAQGRAERLSEIAAELVRLKPEVIVAGGNDATDAARKATSTIPIVFKHGDPIWGGVAGSLALPGKNLTGLSEIAFELAGKRLELLRDTFPKISLVAVLLDADAPVHKRQFSNMEKVAQVLGIQLQALPLHDSRVDFESLFQRAMSERVNAFLTLPNPLVFRYRTPVLQFVAKNRLPAIYPDSEFANAGGLMSYSVDYRDSNRRAAYYVDRILKGAKPSDLPVEQPTKFELVINLATAHQLGLTIPAKVLTWADRVIGDGIQLPAGSAQTPRSAGERQTAQIPRIGVLGRRGNPRLEVFRQALRDLGYVEGQNIAIEYTVVDADEKRLSDNAVELLHAKPDVILATTMRGAIAAKQLTASTPIVTTVIPDAFESSLVNSLDRPGGNVTGLSFMAPALGGKRLELLKETIPGLSRASVLSYVTKGEPAQSSVIKEIAGVARSLNIQVQLLNVKKSEEFAKAFSSMASAKVDALTVMTSAILSANRERIVELAAKNRLPAMYPRSEYVEAGGLMSYGPNYYETYRRAAYYVDRILKGAKPADLPVEQPTKFELVINLKTAKQLGLTIPPRVLMWADRVIE